MALNLSYSSRPSDNLVWSSNQKKGETSKTYKLRLKKLIGFYSIYIASLNFELIGSFHNWYRNNKKNNY